MSLLLFQEEVYETTAKVLIPSVTGGFNATVFAYGATGKFPFLLLVFLDLGKKKTKCFSSACTKQAKH